MKVLVSAIACDPQGYSENFVGWQAVSALAKDHEVWLLTSSRLKQSFEHVREFGGIPSNLHIHFHGDFRPWHPNLLLARMQSWREYVNWSQTVQAAATELHRSIGFDVAHHVTYSTWRVPSSLWKLKIPFVWGPVGGAGTMPRNFYLTLSPSGRIFESIRAAANIARFSPRLRRCAQNARHVLVSSEDTRSVMCDMRGSDSGISILSPGFFSPSQLSTFPSTGALEKPPGELRIFAGGNIIGSKGCALALQALALAKKAGLRFQYTIAGGGPEIPYLRRLASRLCLNEVRFISSLEGEAYKNELKQAHIYLLPSFRENIGLTMMEAMLSGAVPVVLDRSAPGEIVTGESGIKIRPKSIEQVVDQICSAILDLDKDRSRLIRMAHAACARVREGFSEQHYRTVVGEIYRSVCR